MSQSRNQLLASSYSRKLIREKYKFDETVMDLTRINGDFYWDYQLLFDNGREGSAIERAFNTKKPLLKPEIYDYLLNASHQDGYLKNGESVLINHIAEHQKKMLHTNQHRFDYILCENGDLVFVERYYIDKYYDLNSDDLEFSAIASPQKNKPLAICETASLIQVKDKKIQHSLLRNKIFILDKHIGKLFSNDDAIMLEECLTTSAEQIEIELNNGVMMEILNNKAEGTPEKILGSRLSEFTHNCEFSACDNIQLHKVLNLSLELMHMPSDDQSLSDKVRNYDAYSKYLGRSAKWKMVAVGMAVFSASILIAASIAAIVFSFGVAAPFFASILLGVLTAEGMLAVGATGLTAGLFGVASCFGMFGKVSEEINLSKTMRKIYHATKDEQPPQQNASLN